MPMEMMVSQSPDQLSSQGTEVFVGELLSGKVMTPKQADLIGNPPKVSDITCVIFPSACDFKVPFHAGDLVLVPRSRGGLCYGVLDGSHISYSNGKQTIWSVTVGQKMVKPIPEKWLGKVVVCQNLSDQSAANAPDTLGDPGRTIGRRPIAEDLSNVVFSIKAIFEPFEVVLVGNVRGGLSYGFVVEAHGKRHYMVKSHVRDTSAPRRMPAYGLGKLSISRAEQQAMLGTVLARGIEVGTVWQVGGVEATTATGSAAAWGHRDGGNKVNVLQHHRNVELEQAVAASPAASRGGAKINLDLDRATQGFVGRAVTSAKGQVKKQVVSDGWESIDVLGARLPPRTRYPQHREDGTRVVDLPPPSVRVFVIDAANVAVTHGKNQAFSSRGVEIALSHFSAQGHRVLAFLPFYYITAERHYRDSSKHTPDDVDVLQRLINAGTLVLTPSQDYDDEYMIDYAKRYDGVIVSNDRFRDYTDKIERERLHLGAGVASEHKASSRDWMDAHVMSYTFVGDELVGNPAFRTQCPVGIC